MQARNRHSIELDFPTLDIGFGGIINNLLNTDDSTQLQIVVFVRKCGDVQGHGIVQQSALDADFDRFDLLRQEWVGASRGVVAAGLEPVLPTRVSP